ncbi:peptide permease [Anopheles sinensis]|uniref:Peptide permease n=1 Tax=Anopheles sinensis TaxID=74873 RepID=A0A084VW12_ANOSI|nr:peptide permease [Anopheles sinensis]
MGAESACRTVWRSTVDRLIRLSIDNRQLADVPHSRPVLTCIIVAAIFLPPFFLHLGGPKDDRLGDWPSKKCNCFGRRRIAARSMIYLPAHRRGGRKMTISSGLKLSDWQLADGDITRQYDSYPPLFFRLLSANDRFVNVAACSSDRVRRLYRAPTLSFKSSRIGLSRAQCFDPWQYVCVYVCVTLFPLDHDFDRYRDQLSVIDFSCLLSRCVPSRISFLSGSLAGQTGGSACST